jgi:uncharacterized membrane protein YgaE (UPF0421/DUF939 family)
MAQLTLQRLSAWDLAHAIDMAAACAITYCLMAFVINPLVIKIPDLVGTLWAVIATVFVFRDTRARSLSAGISRLAATFVSFILCLVYLILFPANPLGMCALIAIGALFMMSLGRRDEIGLTAITTAVVLIVAASNPQIALRQPLLRLVDTIVGVAVGITCKWIMSFIFYRVVGEEPR